LAAGSDAIGAEHERDIRSKEQVRIAYASGGRVAGPPVAASDDALIAMIRTRAARGGQSPRDFLGRGTVDATVAAFLAAAVRSRCNMIITGSVNVGQTRMLHGQPR
jgi:Flp pilus assembly CpaF family ATPase